MRRGLVALLALVALAAPARAQDVSERRVGVHWVEGVPALDFSAADLADQAAREKLASGLPQTIVMRIFAYRESGQPIAVTARSCRVVYDLWQEVYRVRVEAPGIDRVESLSSLDGVIRRCLIAQRLAVGAASDYRALGGQRIYFATLFELNPLSPQTVQRLRRWLARPAAGGRVGGDAFFGSFVSLFVNRRIGSAERTLRFRSQIVRASP